MSYAKYHTDGFVLKSFDRGEADRAYAILTREFGLVYAHALGAEGSKLRSSLQDLSYDELALVRTRDRWRVTDARSVLGTWKAKDRALVARMLGLVGKLIAEHDPQPELFETIVRGATFAARTTLTSVEHSNLEVLLALRVLKHLGYLGESEPLAHLIASPFVTDIAIFEAGRLRTRALAEINRSIRELPL